MLLHQAKQRNMRGSVYCNCTAHYRERCRFLNIVDITMKIEALLFCAILYIGYVKVVITNFLT